MSTFLTRDMRNIGERTETSESACVKGWLLCIALTRIELGDCQKYRTKDVDKAKDVDFRVITDLFIIESKPENDTKIVTV